MVWPSEDPKPSKEYRVVYEPQKDRWVLKSARGIKPVKVADTKAPVVQKARQVAKNNNARVIVSGKDGRFTDEFSYTS